MEFKFNLTEQDYLDFNIFVMRNYKFYKNQRRIFRILFTLIPIGLGLYFFIFDKKEFYVNLIMLITMVIVSLLFFIFYPELFDKIMEINAKKNSF